jgi:hypothetical protein
MSPLYDASPAASIPLGPDECCLAVALAAQSFTSMHDRRCSGRQRDERDESGSGRANGFLDADAIL